MSLVMIASIAGNFVAGWLANRIGDRLAIASMCLGYFVTMAGTYATALDHVALVILLPVVSVFSGFFALFTMYLPPLFPTLLRTTGAGFCYNIGRIASAVGTVVFGLISVVTDYRIAVTPRRVPVSSRGAARSRLAGFERRTRCRHRSMITGFSSVTPPKTAA